MFEIVGVTVGLWLFIIFSSFCMWVLQMGEDCHNEWQKNVSVDDLRELDRVFKNEN